MRRKLSVLLTFALALAVGVSIASAQAPAGSGWWVGFTVQNAEPGSDITLSATAYHTTGGSTQQYGSTVTLPEGSAVTFHPGLDGTCGSTATNGCRIAFTPALAPGFEGSVVLSSDGRAVAFANINNNPSGDVGASGGAARASYQGTPGVLADTTLYFPTVKHNFVGQTTAFFVQAAGADAEVNIVYTMEDGRTYPATANIDANKMYVFTPQAAGVPSCGGSNGSECIGGAIVTSDTPVAGTVVEYQEGVSVAEFVLSTRGLTTQDIGSTIAAPTMKNNFIGGNTGASILNTSTTSAATVDLSFTVTNVQGTCSVSIGDTATGQVTIPASSSTVVSTFRNNIGGIPPCAFFAMTASTAAHGGENIAITVNEQRVSGGDTFKAVYTGFNVDGATDTVFFPLVKENFVRNTTGLALLNVGTVPTRIEVTYSGSSTHVLRTKEIGPGEAVPLRQVFNGPLNGNFEETGSGLPSANNRYAVQATATVDGAVIVGLAQEATISGTPLDVSNYEGFNQ